MKFIKRTTLLIFLLYSFPVIMVNAQPSGAKNGNGAGNAKEGFGIITGALRDISTNERVEYGSVVLFRSADSTMVTGALTDTKGKFLIEKIKPGKYYIRVQFIGYDNKIIPNVNISNQNADIKLGDIAIQPSSSSLSGVVITSQKAMITNNLDKKVITVDKNMAIGGGTATDVMENVPSVSVDADGNVSLRGNPNITLLIDGKPSSQTGVSASDVLNQIPANAIESVEVITNPSVRYDPDGTTGIINIVLKKKALQGFSGIISGNAGTGDKYNGSLNLNYRQNKFNVFVGADARLNHMKTSMESTRTTTLSDAATEVLKQSQSGSMDRNMYSLSGGIDYYLDTRNNLTFSVQNRNMSFNSTGNTLNNQYNGSDSLLRYFERQNEGSRSVNSYDYTLSYKHLFPQKSREYTNDIIYSSNQMEAGTIIDQQDYLSQGSEPAGIPFRQQNIAFNVNKSLTVQGNYVYPMNENGRIEAGYKASLRDMSMNYDYSYYNDSTDSWVNQEVLKNQYDYIDQLYAVYGIYGNSLGKLKYQAGIRLEQVFTKSKVFNTNTDYNSDYFQFYPSLHTQYDLGKERELQFSYSRRVQRPSPRELNPYVDYSDSRNIETGNPALKPEFATSLELGVQKYWKTSSLTTSIFYNRTKDVVEDITRMQDNGVTLTMPMNINTSTKYGMELIGTISQKKWVKVNANVSLFQDIMSALPEEDIEGSKLFSWNTRLNLAFIPWKDASFQVIGNYNAPTRNIQEYHKEQYYADASFRQDFLKNKLSVSLRLTDVFNTRTFYETTNGNNFSTESTRYRESRVFYVGLQMQINNYNKKLSKDTGNGENGEQDGF
ncbi:MAG: TonB-dependent receptor [Bacteroidales bacterium]|nr:TonB-dependent receptor [Bacteroidales bacterium]